MRQITAMLLSALLLTGCSRKESETKTPPEPPVKSTSPVTPLPATGSLSAPTAGATNTNVATPVDAKKLETEYINAPDLFSKIVVLNRLPDVEPQAAVAMLERLFQSEEDTEMREEIIYTVLDIDGQEQGKLDLLAFALQPQQPQSVRHTGIDLMVELGDADAIPILQNLLTDPNPEIREAAEDAVDQLKIGQ